MIEMVKHSQVVWSSTETYNTDDIIQYDGNFYKSTVNDNVGLTPDEHPGAWEVVGGGYIHYVIAPSDAVNADKADLVLTGVPAEDRTAINQAIEDLHQARGEDTDIAIRIDFLGGNIDLGTKTDGYAIVIPAGYDNIHLYGNGVNITGDVHGSSYSNVHGILDIQSDGVIFDGFDIFNSSEDDNSLSTRNSGTNCTITGNTCSGGYRALYNAGTNCTITGNTCSGEYGLYNTGANCIITGNTCSSNYGNGLNNMGSDCIITGNTCSSNYGSGLYNTGTNCTITGNTCSSYEFGLTNAGTNCTITGNTCSGDYEFGLTNNTTDTTNKVIILGNVCITGGFRSRINTCLPGTDTATMEQFNSGSFTEMT